MDHLRAASGSGEDNAGIPEDLRCKRSDGKQWRCSARSMPDKTVCEKHYIQAKKRAANSAMRASIKKSKRKPSDENDELLGGKNEDMDMVFVDTKVGDHRGSVSENKYRDKLHKIQVHSSPETLPVRSSSGRSSLKRNDDAQRDISELEDNYRTTPASALESSGEGSQRSTSDSASGEDSDGSSDSSEEISGTPCHQCQRHDRGIWCLKCDKRGYCNNCIETWYSKIPLEEIERVCPACRGTCNCKVCLRSDNLVKARIREIPVQDRLQYLYCLLSSVLPLVKRVHYDQCTEVELEKKLCGAVTDLGRIKLNADEQMCCDFCRIPIIDYHRHCANCSYDLCLSCSQDLRRASMLSISGEANVNPSYMGGLETSGVPEPGKLSKLPQHLIDEYPDWKANRDGSIPCPPKKYGGCGCLSLTLRRIFKMNWVAKLAKNVEEMVSGCKVADDCSPERIAPSTSKICQCACREESDGNYLYCTSSQDIKSEGIGEFRKHWMKGEPIIVKEVHDSSSISSWDPMVLWRGIRETADEKMKDENRIVKAIDCLDWSEVDIELGQFIKGYSEGRIHENGWPEILKLKDWPSPSASEEFLMYQRPEFISELPFLEYIHSKWGLLNVAAKLPHYSLQNDVGPRIVISYGSYDELGEGNSVTNLHFSMRDMVYLLVHTSNVTLKGWQRTKIEKMQKTLSDVQERGSCEDLQTSLGVRLPDLSLDLHNTHDEYTNILDSDKDMKVEDQDVGTPAIIEDTVSDVENLKRDSKHVPEKHYPGALLDVFRREDVPKLIEYLRVLHKQFGKPQGGKNGFMVHPLYDESVYLTKHHKDKLKENFGVEAWSFEQHLGQAVFIPAGCPFQVRNLQSTVQLSLDFLSPESLGEAVRLAEEVRCLPNGHEAKPHVLEVGKMSLYAASSAIKEVRKLVLDPKFGPELGFEDPNLTAVVSENLENMVKQRKVACV